MKEILSKAHPLIKRAYLLRTDRKSRDEERRVLVSGRKLIQDLSQKISLEFLFFHGAEPPFTALEKISVSAECLKKITGLEEPDGWAAIVPMPPSQNLSAKNHLLILDQVSDPGNLGTLWRTALALQWDGIWLTPGCVDPFNDKALRAAQGATFELPFERKLPEEIVSWAKTRNAHLWIADLHGTPITQCTMRPPLALVLGNEGQGPGDWTKNSPHLVTIPIANIESLNVASAGAILLYAMRPSFENMNPPKKI